MVQPDLSSKRGVVLYKHSFKSEGILFVKLANKLFERAE